MMLACSLPGVFLLTVLELELCCCCQWLSAGRDVLRLLGRQQLDHEERPLP